MKKWIPYNKVKTHVEHLLMGGLRKEKIIKLFSSWMAVTDADKEKLREYLNSKE
jgi:hypothetical protein